MNLCNGVNLCFLCAIEWLQHPQIPNANLAFIIAWCEQKARLFRAIPTDDIDITITGYPRHGRLALSCTHVPKLNCSVTGAGSKHILLRRRPLKILNWTLVTLEADCEFFYKGRASFICTLIQKELGIVRTWSKATVSARRPIKGISLLPVFEAGNLTSSELFLLNLLFAGRHWAIELLYSLWDIIDGNFCLFRPSCNNWWTMHRSDSVNASTSRNGFISDNRLFMACLFFITIGALFIFVSSLLHLSPFHNIEPIVSSLFCLRAGNHVDIHRELVFLVTKHVIACWIIHRVWRVGVQMTVRLGWEPSWSRFQSIHCAPLAYQVIDWKARPFNLRSMQHHVCWAIVL